MNRSGNRKRLARLLRKPTGMSLTLGIVNTCRVVFLLGSVALLTLGIITQYGLWIFAALFLFIPGFALGLPADILSDAVKARKERLAAHQLKRARVPHLKAWLASLLDASLQPSGADLVPIDHASIIANEDMLELRSADMERIAALGLEIYQDPRDHGTRWIGRINRADPSHSAWWYTEHPYKPHTWYACAREFIAAHSTDSAPHPAPGKKLDYLFSTMLFETKGPQEASLGLIRAGVAPREELWLREFIQAFGHANPHIIQLMPTKVDWDNTHQILHHYAAWQQANNAQDVPQELALRMCGLGSVVDQVAVERLLKPTW